MAQAAAPAAAPRRRRRAARRDGVTAPATGGGRTVRANGVDSYYEAHGAGAPLLLLHGGLETIESFAALVPALAERCRVLLPERRGHGRTPDGDGPLSYELMAADTIAFAEALGIASAHLAGYSDGANVAMLIAIARPQLVRRLVLISGNFDASGMTDAFQAQLADATAERYAPALAAAYARLSPDGAGHFAVMFEKLRRLWLEQPHIAPVELARITAPTLVLCGDRDLVRLEHTLELFRAIPGARLAVVPGSSHGVIEDQPALVTRLLLNFLDAGPVAPARAG
ncbi:MAG: alpha/beta hydrolase [Dehalococcoidia bacterium]|nr:alpha/beta hydrolase [Dehalococcoidia bacterium]